MYVVYRVGRTSQLTHGLLSIVAADLHGNARPATQLGDHQRVFLDDALVQLQELLGVSLVHRQFEHRTNAKSAVRDPRYYVTSDT